ncbi:hypothetical protein HG536_0C01730 [Torulaspora globosa]|uniref:F-box protein Hrt3/FBXO9 C-terminal domain-containing protein n=1 Tax=Torulaspora globosa TaxID=48254 RepID=A0A7G3ZER9_9SACH|nr:uncharacterized protein HG536_0C01730 [Torulaspora globosa]QLL32005.1 hypothetical protein HG536_0C01730 [Torulaspora globosa]
MSIVEDDRAAVAWGRSDQAIEHQALSIWEKGVQKERDGSMTDAIKYYRQALKIDEKVEKIYRKKLREEWLLQQKLAELQLASPVASQGTAADSANTNEDGNEAEMEPCWIFEKLPNDLLLRVIRQVILMSGESWLNLSLTCTKFNELCFHNSGPFQVFASYIYQKQRYDETSLELNHISDLGTLEHDLWNSNYEKMLKDRPYIKFEGLYISVVNYLRHGVNSEGSSSLISPIQMITYYRYFRFYSDGHCLRLVTTDEPSQVVPHFSIDVPPRHSEICRWSLGLEDNFGRLIIRRSGEKYSFVEELHIKSHGRRRHHRLLWINSLVIDKEGNVSECSLRNEKPFNFSRVRSFASDD